MEAIAEVMETIDVHDDGDLKIIFDGVAKGLSFEEIRDLVSEHHADLADRQVPDLEWWIKNNREIEVLEGGNPDEAEARTRELFAKDPLKFTRPE